jgi:hypothetical protein
VPFYKKYFDKDLLRPHAGEPTFAGCCRAEKIKFSNEHRRMESLKFYLGPPWLTLLRPADGPPLKLPCSHFRDGPRPQGGRPATVCYPLGHPMSYYYVYNKNLTPKMAKMSRKEKTFSVFLLVCVFCGRTPPQAQGHATIRQK